MRRNNIFSNIDLISRSSRWGARFSRTVQDKFIWDFCSRIMFLIAGACTLGFVYLFSKNFFALHGFSMASSVETISLYVWANIDSISFCFILLILSIFNLWIFMLYALKSVLLHWLLYYKLDIDRSDSIDELEEEMDHSWTLERQVSRRDYFSFVNLYLKTLGFVPAFKLFMKIRLIEYFTGQDIIASGHSSSTYTKLILDTPGEFEFPANPFYTHEERLGFLTSPNFQSYLTEWLSDPVDDDAEQYKIFESIFDDFTLSTISKFGLFYSRLFKSVYFINALNNLSVCSEQKCAIQTLSTDSSKIYNLRHLLYFHTQNYWKPEFTSILLDTLVSSTDFINHQNSNIFTQLEKYTLNVITSKCEEVNQWVNDPFFLQNFSMNDFNDLLHNSNTGGLLLDLANSEISSRRWGRWMYKFSFTERHSLSALSNLANMLRTTSSGFFNSQMFSVNLWANAEYATMSNVQQIPYLYNLIYGLTLNDPDPVLNNCLSRLDHYLLSNFSQWDLLEKLPQTYAWFLRRLLLSTGLKISKIRSSNLNNKINAEHLSVFNNQFHYTDVSCLTNLAQLLAHNSLLTSNVNSIFFNIANSKFLNSASEVFPTRVLNLSDDIKLNFEWAQFFSIFNLADCMLLLIDNSHEYYSSYDLMQYTNIAINSKDSLFAIDLNEAATNKNSDVFVKQIEQYDFYFYYYPQLILARDIELLLHNFF